MPATADTVINLRTRSEQKALIERAAKVAGMNRTQFILEASVQRAESVLADRTRFELSAQQFTRFIEALEAPLPNPDALRRLLKRRPSWDRSE